MNPPTERPRLFRLGEFAAQVFPGLLGLWLALALIKFGNPVILDHQVPAPTSWLEAMVQPWPVSWGYGVFLIAFVTGLPFWRWRTSPALVLLPALWLGFQFISAVQSVRPQSTLATLPHFAVCVTAFYLGYFALCRVDRLKTFALATTGGWAVVVLIGWRQHFGGLEELRAFFHAMPDWQEQPAELIAKLASNRIFSTLVYPNALAGVMLLFTPAVVLGAWSITQAYPTWTRLIFASVPLTGAIGCLVWSGSKGGWLIALGLVVVALACRVTLSPRRVLLLVLLILMGGGGFWYRYRDYFQRGATSVSARFDYWSVALSSVRSRPLLGSGPGTFMEVYRRSKPPTAEMTRLVHNDYLQQAADSGIPAGLLFLALVGGAIYAAYPGRSAQPVQFGMWLGVAGIAVQSLMEFGLYIPALAWPWFLGMGTLLGLGSRGQKAGPGKTNATSSAFPKTVDKTAGST